MKLIRTLPFIAAAALAGCDEAPRPSVAEIMACAQKAFAGHTGTFSQIDGGGGIAYSYESPNGPARVVVQYDKDRNPGNTLYVRTPYQSHRELVDAADVIKRCFEPRPPEGPNAPKSVTSQLKQ